MKFNDPMIQKDVKGITQEAMRIFEESMDHEDTEILLIQIELYRLDLMTAMYERQLTKLLEPHSYRWTDTWDALVEVKLKQEALAAYLASLTSEDAGADHDHDGDKEGRQTW